MWWQQKRWQLLCSSSRIWSRKLWWRWWSNQCQQYGPSQAKKGHRRNAIGKGIPDFEWSKRGLSELRLFERSEKKRATRVSFFSTPENFRKKSLYAIIELIFFVVSIKKWHSELSEHLDFTYLKYFKMYQGTNRKTLSICQTGSFSLETELKEWIPPHLSVIHQPLWPPLEASKSLTIIHISNFVTFKIIITPL